MSIFFHVYDSIYMLKILCSPVISCFIPLQAKLGDILESPSPSVRLSVCLLSVCLSVRLFVCRHNFVRAWIWKLLFGIIWKFVLMLKSIWRYATTFYMKIRQGLMILWEFFIFIVYILHTYVEKDGGSLQILWNKRVNT